MIPTRRAAGASAGTACSMCRDACCRKKVIHSPQESGRRRACRSLGLMRRGPDAGRCGSLVETAVTELSLLISAFRLDENGAIWLAPVATSVGAGRWQGRVRCRRARRHRRCAGHRRPAGPADVGVCVRQVSASRAAAQRRLPAAANWSHYLARDARQRRDPGVATGCPPLAARRGTERLTRPIT
jgi:hypothetical protein